MENLPEMKFKSDVDIKPPSFKVVEWESWEDYIEARTRFENQMDEGNSEREQNSRPFKRIRK